MGSKTAKERMDDTLLEMAKTLYNVGEADVITMRKYATLHVPEVRSLQAKDIKRIRLKEKVSQAVFARLLNISPETVKKWEQGERRPTGASLKLLNLAAHWGLKKLCYRS